MEKEFDVVKLIRSVRNVKAYVTKVLMDDKHKIAVQNGLKTVIDIDDIREETPSDSDSDAEAQQALDETHVENQLVLGMRQIVNKVQAA